MPTNTQTLVIGTFALLSVSGLVLAQTAPAAITTTAASAQIPTQQGQLKQFLLNPRGDIDGLILADGTEVNTPPHLSEQLAATFKPGDSINVAGLRAASLPLVQAVSLTNVQTGKTVTDEGPERSGKPRPPPPRPGAERDNDSLQGQIVQLLHGPRGNVNGALLQDGTALRLPPHEALRLQALLKPGQSIAARGELVANAQGRAFRVSALGTDANSLQALDTPPGPRGPGRLPPPPPPGVQPVAPGAQPLAPPAPPAG
ncbi:hypothetical protein [Pseudomonas sp. PLB05]|uniref:hypothetical protein n=1 Tax=Pseudomonas sp. PLB05 TaxID=2899078 RepID=UPI001E62AF2A|nr:hypothetical protein [Pseudomonas sp. PLB05]MCD4865951.1 hypothetical protein [Pseudomonas sp. PLB05]